MPKRLSKDREEREASNAPPVPTRSEISRIMSAMGRKGGKKSARARMALLTPERRKEIALKAARARWAEEKKLD